MLECPRQAFIYSLISVSYHMHHIKTDSHPWQRPSLPFVRPVLCMCVLVIIFESSDQRQWWWHPPVLFTPDGVVTRCRWVSEVMLVFSATFRFKLIFVLVLEQEQKPVQTVLRQRSVPQVCVLLFISLWYEWLNVAKGFNISFTFIQPRGGAHTQPSCDIKNKTLLLSICSTLPWKRLKATATVNKNGDEKKDMRENKDLFFDCRGYRLLHKNS